MSGKIVPGGLLFPPSGHPVRTMRARGRLPALLLSSPHPCRGAGLGHAGEQSVSPREPMGRLVTAPVTVTKLTSWPSQRVIGFAGHRAARSAPNAEYKRLRRF